MVSSSAVKLMGTHSSLLLRCPGTGKFKIPRHDADHGVGLPIEEDLRSQNLRITVQAIPPERVTDDCYLLTLVIFLLGKDSPHQRRDPEGRKHPG